MTEKSRTPKCLDNDTSFCLDKEEEEERVAAMTHDLAKVGTDPITAEDEEENLQDEELMADGVSCEATTGILWDWERTNSLKTRISHSVESFVKVEDLKYFIKT